MYWDNELNVCTWSMLGTKNNDATDAEILAYLQTLGITIADRCYFIGNDTDITEEWHALEVPSSPAESFAGYEYSVLVPERAKEIAAQHHANGLKAISFTSVHQWNPADADNMLALLKTHVDCGFDGIHLDMFNGPSDTGPTASPDAARYIADGLKAYARETQNKDFLFSGNTWTTDDGLSLRLAAACDVAWIESWGGDMLANVLSARLAKASTGDPTNRAVWYHLQPNTDEFWKANARTEYAKALMAACMLEDATFLCNMTYPICDSADKTRGPEGTWKFYKVQPEWEKHVFSYGAFLNRYKDLFTGASPVSDVAFAITPDALTACRPYMACLLAANISFNVVFCNEPHFPALDADLIAGYKQVLSMEPLPFSGVENILLPALSPDECAARLAAGKSAFLDFNDARLIGRVMQKDGKRIVHIMNNSYDLEADKSEAVSGATAVVCAPGATEARYISPELADEVVLACERDGDLLRFVLPAIAFYGTIVLQ